MSDQRAWLASALLFVLTVAISAQKGPWSCKGQAMFNLEDGPAWMKEGCRIYKKACLDQETIILFDPEVVSGPGADLSMDVSMVENIHIHHVPSEFWQKRKKSRLFAKDKSEQIDTHVPHARPHEIRFHRVHARAPAKGEEGLLDHLKDDIPWYFSNCTIPIVW